MSVGERILNMLKSYETSTFSKAENPFVKFRYGPRALFSPHYYAVEAQHFG